MQTVKFSGAISRLRIEASPDPVADLETRRTTVRQAEWQVRRAERRLSEMLGRFEALTPDEPAYAAAIAEIHRCERALFNRRLELREACDAVRRYLPCRSAQDPVGRREAVLRGRPGLSP
jgi:hypothetical protein